MILYDLYVWHPAWCTSDFVYVKVIHAVRPFDVCLGVFRDVQAPRIAPPLPRFRQ